MEHKEKRYVEARIPTPEQFSETRILVRYKIETLRVGIARFLDFDLSDLEHYNFIEWRVLNGIAHEYSSWIKSHDIRANGYASYLYLIGTNEISLSEARKSGLLPTLSLDFEQPRSISNMLDILLSSIENGIFDDCVDDRNALARKIVNFVRVRLSAIVSASSRCIRESRDLPDVNTDEQNRSTPRKKLRSKKRPINGKICLPRKSRLIQMPSNKRSIEDVTADIAMRDPKNKTSL